MVNTLPGSLGSSPRALALYPVPFPGQDICLQTSDITTNRGQILIIGSLTGSTCVSNQYHYFLLLRVFWRRRRPDSSHLDRREPIRSEAAWPAGGARTSCVRKCLQRRPRCLRNTCCLGAPKGASAGPGPVAPLLRAAS